MLAFKQTNRFIEKNRIFSICDIIKVHLRKKKQFEANGTKRYRLFSTIELIDVVLQHSIQLQTIKPPIKLFTFLFTAYMEPDRLTKRYRRRRAAELLVERQQNASIFGRRSKRAVPHTIFPEILVIVDYDGYRLHGGDNVQVKRYFVSFWNGVDLRYRLLKGPRIRISIAGIIISRVGGFWFGGVLWLTVCYVRDVTPHRTWSEIEWVATRSIRRRP